jgi:GMC oxidoreductase.
MGGTIMGHDAKDSVVDGWMRTHDHQNLYIGLGGCHGRSRYGEFDAEYGRALPASLR